MKFRTLLVLATAIFSMTLTASAQARSAGAAIVAIDEPPTHGASGGGYAGVTERSKSAVAKGTVTPAKSTTRSRTTVKPVQKSTPAPRLAKAWDGFVVGDKYTFLNFEVISAEKPYYTRAAKASGAKGLVQVEITIDEKGNVLTAHGRTGNKELHPEAERAALASKFNRPTFGGKPAHAIGFLVYRFGPAEDDD
jgi:TonB-like protein